MKKHISISTIIMTIMLAGFLAAGCGQGDAPREGGEHGGEHAHEEGHGHEDEGHIELTPEALETISLKTAAAEKRPVGGEIKTTAVIEPDKTRIAHVSPRIPGRVSTVNAFLGDKVTKGEVLAELDSIELGQAKAEYLKAKADLEVARANFSREERLYGREITSEKEFLDARGEFLRAEAALNTSRETLRLLGLSESDVKAISWTERKSPPSLFPLKAPFDGTIIEQHTVLGELVAPENNAYTIADLTHLWIQLDVYEKDLRHVGKGKPVDVMVDAYPGEKFTGEVTYVSDVLDESTRTARARVEIGNEDGRLKPGMFASALISIPGEGGEALTVPSSAVQQVRGKPTVFVREGEGVFEAREITAGRDSGEYVEVLSGVSPGDEVVTEGGFYLKSLMLKDEMGEGHAH